MTDMAMRPATHPTEATPLPSSVDIDEEISGLEAYLAHLCGTWVEAATEDREPWVLDHAGDDWEDSPAVGATAFSRRVHAAGLLTAEDEVTLARRLEAGVLAQERLDSGVEMLRTRRRGLEHVVREGEEARERMILANGRLVAAITRSFLPRATPSMDFEDLQQAGFMGLMRAVDKFDHTLGYKFSTYATWWIKQSMGRALDDESRTIRLPVYVAESTRAIDTARRRAGLTWDEAVTAPGRLGCEHTVEGVERARRLLRPCLSLDEIGAEVDVVDDGEDPLEVTADRADAERTWHRLAEHLREQPGLGERAVDILQLRYGFDGQDTMTLDEIGRRYDVTRERIRQIEKKALEALREGML